MKDTESTFNPFIFWAKTSHDKENQNAYHPLLCHLIDVAAVTLTMWDEVLSSALKNRITKAFGLDEETTKKLVAWIAGLHDLGKASPPFALRGVYEKARQTEKLLKLYDNTLFSRIHLRSVEQASKAPHGYVTTRTLPLILEKEFLLPNELANRIAVLIGAHHGVFPRSEDITALKTPSRIGNEAWAKARTDLTLLLARLLELPAPIAFPSDAKFDHAATMFLAGLVSVADWIGSNADYFPCKIEDFENPLTLNAQDYFQEAKDNARKALTQLGWLNWTEPTATRSFEDLFPNLKKFPLRGVQKAAIQISSKLNSPGIVVIEAPMGEGKTEAAMFLADYWNVQLCQRGIYFALPTQATSNQMFSRVKKFLATRFDEDKVLLQLLHGHASLSAEFEALKRSGEKAFQLEGVSDDGMCKDKHCLGKVVAAEWFTYRKRGLLAPYGVGTVDQALMAVLQTRHVFVRLFGLAHKTIIIDEVHAYDAYMSTLLERLLEWLAALGSPVILLSATLPKSRRKKLLEAYTKGLGKELSHHTDAVKEAHYPLITWLIANHTGIEPIETNEQSSRTLHLRWLDGRINEDENEPFEIGEILRQQLANGGCAAVICNTVDRAQKVYRRLKEIFSGKADDGYDTVDLLHARFLFKDRAERELRTLIRFGKDGEEVTDRDGNKHEVKRPDCAILVATQIIEQSLDIDFDLIITDLAPIDLLLQRSGREWRHERSGRGAIASPILWICQPEKNNKEALDFGHSGLIYDKHILLRSWLELKKCESLNIPADVENLIEQVYDDEREFPKDEDETMKIFWDETKAKRLEKRNTKETHANTYRILSPHDNNLLEHFNLQLEEDSPDYHRTRQAQTRDDDTPSISVVFLKPDENHLLKSKPEIRLVKKLLERSVNISKRGAANELINRKSPSEWSESPLLRHHRLVEVEADGNSQPIGDWRFRLNLDLGIVIEKNKSVPPAVAGG
ncbi:MAG: CRISPR-associated helicase Cas3' [Acidobacteria bacterium]|nr:CRISPR-associated helicase Cas3' [Acidobacteriota bacterium]